METIVETERLHHSSGISREFCYYRSSSQVLPNRLGRETYYFEQTDKRANRQVTRQTNKHAIAVICIWLVTPISSSLHNDR